VCRYSAGCASAAAHLCHRSAHWAWVCQIQSIFLYLSVFFCICLYFSVFVCIFLYLSVFFCICLYFSVFVCIFLYLSVFFCICLYFSVFVCIFLYLSVFFCTVHQIASIFRSKMSRADHGGVLQCAEVCVFSCLSCFVEMETILRGTRPFVYSASTTKPHAGNC